MTDQLTMDRLARQAAEPQPVGPVGLPIYSKNSARLTAAGYLGVGRTTIYRLLAEGELEGFHIGAASMVTRASLDAYVARQRAAEPTRA